jgi:hypothetical protein
MWGTALALIAQPMAHRVRRAVRRGVVMAFAFAFAALAFLLGLGAIFALLEPRFGPATAAAILAGGMAFISLVLVLLASRDSRPRQVVPLSPTTPSLTSRENSYSWQLLAAAFAAGIAAGRKW